MDRFSRTRFRGILQWDAAVASLLVVLAVVVLAVVVLAEPAEAYPTSGAIGRVSGRRR